MVSIAQWRSRGPTVCHLQVQAFVMRLAVTDLTLRVGVGLRVGSRFAVFASTWLVLVFGVIFLMLLSQTLCFLDKRPLIRLVQQPETHICKKRLSFAQYIMKKTWIHYKIAENLIVKCSTNVTHNSSCKSLLGFNMKVLKMCVLQISLYLYLLYVKQQALNKL